MQPINEFSLLCRLFGNLFYRTPTDPILSGTFQWLASGQLHQHWALALDTQSEKALECISQAQDCTQLEGAYQALFGENGQISTKMSDFGIKIDEFISFRAARGLPELPSPDHVALLLLTASWLEDNVDSTLAQQQFFSQFLLPAMGRFLGQVEAFDGGFYRALAQLCRDALSAMADELEEVSEADEADNAESAD